MVRHREVTVGSHRWVDIWARHIRPEILRRAAGSSIFSGVALLVLWQETRLLRHDRWVVLHFQIGQHNNGGGFGFLCPLRWFWHFGVFHSTWASQSRWQLGAMEGIAVVGGRPDWLLEVGRN